ncbi:hypothetical protein [Nocardia brasiliensis]|uniref:hypothetical protein n=1 Tax=Nocardia brasiliensis TaxID=37326 RepID=UPI003D8CD8FA
MIMKYSYGHVWADWLYGNNKDRFMISVYDECKYLDECKDISEKAYRLLQLREKIKGSSKSWTEGIEDYIDWETTSIVTGEPLVEPVGDSEGSHALGILHAAYLHGAFRGLCRTASGEEWIGQLGEYAAAAIHQGFKWLRVGGLNNWEMPVLGEAWCKGMAMWGQACLFAAVDTAGIDPDNDRALYRIHEVISGHHMAGYCWKAYRGEHPHKYWSEDAEGVIGRAPSPAEIRDWGARHAIAPEAVEVMTRAAEHINTWINIQSSDPDVYVPRTRGLAINTYTPRLMASVENITAEFLRIAEGYVDDELAEELLWRTASWMATITSLWRGRDGANEKVAGWIPALGGFASVLRDRLDSGVPQSVADLSIGWATKMVHHLHPEQQEFLLSTVRELLEVRGRIRSHGASVSQGVGAQRWVDGSWELTMWGAIFGGPPGETIVPHNLRHLLIRFFNAIQGPSSRKPGYMPLDDPDGGCPTCVGNDLFMGLIENRPSLGVLQTTTWGILQYSHQGFGDRNNINLGTESRVRAKVPE